MNPSHSCYCTQYQRLKHRGVTCPTCGVDVRLNGWRSSAYIRHRIEEIRERLRSRIHAIFGRVSRWLDNPLPAKPRSVAREQVLLRMTPKQAVSYARHLGLRVVVAGDGESCIASRGGMVAGL